MWKNMWKHVIFLIIVMVLMKIIDELVLLYNVSNMFS